MIKNGEFNNIQVQSHATKGFIWEITISDNVVNIPTHLVISLTRPEVNEDAIRRDITYRYQEKLKNSLFSDAVREEIEEESKREIDLTYKRIRSMPNPVIFQAHLSEYKDSSTKLLLKIDKSVGLYLFKNAQEMGDMLITIDSYPEYMRGEEEVKRIVEQFKDTHEDYLDTEDLLD